jgi:hypothetical protein
MLWLRKECQIYCPDNFIGLSILQSVRIHVIHVIFAKKLYKRLFDVRFERSRKRINETHQYLKLESK